VRRGEARLEKSWTPAESSSTTHNQASLNDLSTKLPSEAAAAAGAANATAEPRAIRRRSNGATAVYG